MFEFWNKLTSVWGYDENEKTFIISSTSKKPDQKNSDRQTVVLQAAENYYFLALFSGVKEAFSKEDDYRFVAMWPTIFSVKQKFDWLHPLRILYSIFNAFFREEKWIKLYQSIADPILFIDKGSPLNKIKNGWRAIRIWLSLSSKDDLIRLSIDEIYCGDLIYDTYLRYRVRPTVRLGSISLLHYIYKCIGVIASVQEIVTENNINYYFSSYSTYIQHGIPVRIFLNHGIEVYASGNFQQRFKKLTKEDWHHTSAHKNYFSQFKMLEGQSEKIAKGVHLLENKFKGAIDSATAYMQRSAFHSSSNTKEPLDYDGVVFMHDFYDSPHIYSSMLFPDFYEWAIFTLDLISKNNLRVGVKPHPNQVANSKKDIASLKRQFPSIRWIDPQTSNIQIFNSGIQFGISVYGTVLHELAYQGINQICAGDNPHVSFEVVHSPKPLPEYESMIL